MLRRRHECCLWHRRNVEPERRMRAVQMQPGQQRRLLHHSLWVWFVSSDEQQYRNSRNVRSAIVFEEGKTKCTNYRVEEKPTCYLPVLYLLSWLAPFLLARMTLLLCLNKCLKYQSFATFLPTSGADMIFGPLFKAYRTHQVRSYVYKTAINRLSFQIHLCESFS